MFLILAGISCPDNIHFKTHFFMVSKTEEINININTIQCCFNIVHVKGTFVHFKNLKEHQFCNYYSLM